MEGQALSYLNYCWTHHFPQEPKEGASRVCHVPVHLGPVLGSVVVGGNEKGTQIWSYQLPVERVSGCISLAG